MSAQAILTQLASEGGIRAEDADQQKLALFRINMAAEELYNQDDLIGSLREQVMLQQPTEGNQITLPFYVGNVRAVRYFYPQYNLRQVDMRPRYAAKMWQAKNFLKWRLKYRLPIANDISNASPITISFPQAVEKVINITFIGRSDNAERTTEVVTFNVGDTTKTTTNSWESFDEGSIAKDVTCLYDCILTDVDGKFMARIPNHQLNSLYLLYQIVDLPNNSNGSQSAAYSAPTNYVEVLWKATFKPFVNLTDEFLGSPAYDKAIYWIYRKHDALRGDSPNTEAALACQLQANKVVKDVANDAEQSMDKYINFGANPYIDAFEHIQQSNYQQHPRYVDGSQVGWSAPIAP